MNQNNSSTIELIQKLGITSTQLADALDKTGVLPGLRPISDNFSRCGVIHPVYSANCSNYELLSQLENVPKNSICVVFTHNFNEIALMGYHTCNFLFTERKVAGLVVNGYLRDKAELIESNFAIWTFGYSPIGCRNIPAAPFPSEIKHELNYKFKDSPVVCDSTGVVAIPNWEMEDPEKINKAISYIHHKEIIWHYCIQELGWSTFKTVCEQAYLTDQRDLIVENLKSDLKNSLIKVRDYCKVY